MLQGKSFEPKVSRKTISAVIFVLLALEHWCSPWTLIVYKTSERSNLLNRFLLLTITMQLLLAITMQFLLAITTQFSLFTRLSDQRLNPYQKVSCDHFISIFVSQAYLRGECMTACNYWSIIALSLLLLLPAIVFVIFKTDCRLLSD